MHHNRLSLTIVFLLFALFFVGLMCDNNDGPSLASFRFPLEVGNSWKYARHTLGYDWEPEGIGGEYVDTIFDTSYTEVISLDSVSETLAAYRLETDWYSNGDSGFMIEYIYTNDSGLFEHSYSAPTWVGPPKINLDKGEKLIFKGKAYNNYDELYRTFVQPIEEFSAGRLPADTLTHESHPVEALDYPLALGKRWVYRDAELGDSWDMDKKIVKIENITVPAGKQTCFKIQWFWDIDDDGDWDTDIRGYDYLSPIGYLKREFDFYGITRTNESGDTLGTYDSKDIYELIDYNIAEEMEIQ